MTDADPTRPVQYRDVPGFPGYRVGDDGSVWTCRDRWGLRPEWTQMCPEKGRKRYLSVYFRRDGRRVRRMVHSLVLLAFVGPRPVGMDACHGNGECTDNRLMNLRWDTRQANVDDMRAHGVTARGAANGQAKITEATAAEILRACSDGERQKDIAARLGIRLGIVSSVVLGKAWRHVPGPRRLSRVHRPRRRW